MKKLVAYLLIIIINAHALAALWFAVDIQWQRQSMYARISTQDVPSQYMTLLELTAQDLKSKDFVRVNSKEIKYKGELYDLVKVEQVGNITRFHCVWDKHEELLQESLQQQVAQQNPYAQETGALVTQLFEKLWVYPFAASQLNPNLPFITQLHPSDASKLPYLFLEVLSPPPQITCG